MQWHAIAEKPESGKRIVALYNDGSGAQLFLVHDHGIMDNDGEEYTSIGSGFDKWAYLPDDFRLWIEDKLDD